MSNGIYTPEYLTGTREDPFDRRQRERREEAAKREKQAAKRENLQAQQVARPRQRSEEWHVWFQNELLAATELHDAIGEVIGEKSREVRDELKSKIAPLEDRIKELESKLALSKRFDDLERNFAARQLALNEAKKGAPGADGARRTRRTWSARREGRQGRARNRANIYSTKIDEHYNLVILRSGDVLEIIPLREAFERYHSEVSGG